MVTMADVAREAEVSVSTVSHILNGTRYVADDTKQRVLDAIRQTGYIHNTIARSLVTQSTQTIGLAISAISNFYFADMVASIESVAGEAGYTLLLADTHDDPDGELRVVQALHQRRVDGMLFAPSTGRGGPALRYLADLNVPTVLVDRCAWNRFDQIGSENPQATAELTRHLISHGHTRIALISGPERIRSFAERADGYRRALRDAGLPDDTGLIAAGNPGKSFAQEAVDRFWNLPEPPTAIVAANNHLCIEVMRELNRRGLRVPDDLALVAYDDFEWADLFHPRLTAMAQPIETIGAGAVKLLIERIADPNRPTRTVRLDPVFQRRNSCGCADSDHDPC